MQIRPSGEYQNRRDDGDCKGPVDVNESEMKRPGISTIIICKDNESYIRNCLESIDWTEEVVAVDSGSADNTLEILKEKGARTFYREWEGFRKQKEYAMNLASYDWILEIDTDELLSVDLIEEIRNIPPRDWSRYSCFEMPRLTYFQNKPVYHCGWYPDHKPRLYNRKSGNWVGITIHEHFQTGGLKKKLHSLLIHRPPWDLTSFLKRTVEYAIINASDYHQKGRKSSIFDLTIRPFYTFLYKYFIRKGFLDGYAGLLICTAESFGVFVKYHRLMQLNSRGSGLHS